MVRGGDPSSFRRTDLEHIGSGIHAVEISKKIRQAVKEEAVIKQVSLGKCKHCDSENIVKDSVRKFKKGNVQQFKCNDCGKRCIYSGPRSV